MLDNNIVNIEAIVMALRAIHKNDEQHLTLPAGITYNKKDKAAKIEYGFNDETKGALLIKREQFEITQISNKDRMLEDLKSYNHSDSPYNSKQSYIDALKCTDLKKNEKAYASAIIILTAECARSDLVLDVIRKLFNGVNLKLDNDVWNGLLYAFKNYSATCKYKNMEIKAGNPTWEPLAYADYTAYIQSLTDEKIKAKNLSYFSAIAVFLKP